MSWITHMEARQVLLAGSLGIRPLGQVTASAVLVPNVTGTPASSMEVSDRSRLRTEGWRLALERMQRAAREAKASGIVGVRT